MSDQVLYCVLIPGSRGTLDVRPSALLCVDTWITWKIDVIYAKRYFHSGHVQWVYTTNGGDLQRDL